MTDPRRTAFNALLKIENDSAFSNLVINNEVKENNLSGLDSAFFTALVYGVLERKLTLDYIIKQYSKIPLRKIELKTKIILRLGILQLLFMDKIPESAAVNESVKLAKWQKLQKSSGFINGILRSIVRSEVKYSLPDKQADKMYYYSIKYSCPREIVELWYNSYGEENTVELLKALSGRAEIYIRVNTLKTDPKSLINELEKENAEVQSHPFLENALKIKNTGSVERLGAYRKGLFHIQNPASQLCVELLDPKPRQIVLDVCSAPGGKSFTAAELMNDRGKILACDIYAHKLRLIEKGAQRLGIKSVSTLLRNAAESGAELPLADRIICDVPCSGLGVLSRKPEIRYKENLIDEKLSDLQYKILCESSKHLAVGGRLVYSTCTLNPAENNKNAERFLSEQKNFRGVSIRLPEGIKRAFDEKPFEITLMPHTSLTDGFYIAVFERTAL